MDGEKRIEDGFARTAISFILGVILGFTLFLFGLAFLMISMLATATTNTEIPAWGWFLMGLVAIVLGLLLMSLNLRTSPPLNVYK